MGANKEYGESEELINNPKHPYTKMYSVSVINGQIPSGMKEVLKFPRYKRGVCIFR
ncbi:MAG: hypothetical protein ACLRPW_10555 [Intestinibacter sp.]